MCPFSKLSSSPTTAEALLKASASLPATDGPNRFSPTAVRDWQPRRKSVSNACERCRRRKIRCDGDTPCATCRRFMLQCVRTQKPREIVASEHQEALEGRIHQLEAQLAAHVNAPMHGMEGIDQTITAAASATFDWQNTPPPVGIGSAFPVPADLVIPGFPRTSMPSISINQCEPAPNMASPSSPVPSFWSGTTRASSPDTNMPPTSAPSQFASIPHNMLEYENFSPPIEPHTAPSWEFMAQPNSSHPFKTSKSRVHSRNTSASSVSFNSNSEDQAMSPIPEVETDLLPLAPAPRLPRLGIFAATNAGSPAPASSRSSYTDRSRAISTIPMPSRFEAETLTAEFLQYIDSLPSPTYGLSPSTFGHFCEMVYPNTQGTSPVPTTNSIAMARFHVFLAMATSMKLRIKDSPESTNTLLDTCYDLAMQQASISTFWQEDGGIEGAQLLAIFASIRKTPMADHRPLQPSFTW